MTRRRVSRDGVPTPGQLGLPEHSALTVEGRVERAAMVGKRQVRRRDGRERAVRQSNWVSGLWLIGGVFGLLIAGLAVLYLLG